MPLWLSNCEWNTVRWEGSWLGGGLTKQRIYQGPATENIAVFTTSSFCVYPDALLQTAAWTAQVVGDIPPVGVPRFLFLEANVP